LAQRALRKKPGVSADYPGFFINALRYIESTPLKNLISISINPKNIKNEDETSINGSIP
jgi:hypothetical protein